MVVNIWDGNWNKLPKHAWFTLVMVALIFFVLNYQFNYYYYTSILNTRTASVIIPNYIHKLTLLYACLLNAITCHEWTTVLNQWSRVWLIFIMCVRSTRVCGNWPLLTILNKARTNTLQLNARNRHTNKLINCMVCDTDNKEYIYHFLLHCTAYKEERSQTIHLQQPLYRKWRKHTWTLPIWYRERWGKERVASCHMEKKTTSNKANTNKIVNFNV